MAEDEEAAPVKEPEKDEERSARHKKELDQVFGSHMYNMRGIHDQFNIPIGAKFEELNEEQQKAHGERSKHIVMANRAYHLEVKRLCQEHRTQMPQAAPEAVRRARSAERRA